MSAPLSSHNYLTGNFNSNKLTEENYKDRTIVIKMGGDLLTHDAVYTIATQVAELCKLGAKPIIVHGGALYIDELLEERNIPVEQDYDSGVRRTTREVIEIADEILKIKNQEIVTIFKEVFKEMLGDNSKILGIDGYENNLILAKKAATHFGGRATSINKEYMNELVNTQGLIPIINPICMNENPDSDEFRINPNGDDVAMRIFEQMNSKNDNPILILCSDTCVWDKNKKPLSNISEKEIDDFIKDEVIKGGMIIKVKDAKEAALFKPNGKVFILNGSKENAILNAISEKNGSATLICSHKEEANNNIYLPNIPISA